MLATIALVVSASSLALCIYQHRIMTNISSVEKTNQLLFYSASLKRRLSSIEKLTAESGQQEEYLIPAKKLLSGRISDLFKSKSIDYKKVGEIHRELIKLDLSMQNTEATLKEVVSIQNEISQVQNR